MVLETEVHAGSASTFTQLPVYIGMDRGDDAGGCIYRDGSRRRRRWMYRGGRVELGQAQVVGPQALVEAFRSRRVNG